MRIIYSKGREERLMNFSLSVAVITCDNILFPTYSTAHHPPVPEESTDGHVRGEEKYTKMEPVQPSESESNRRTEIEQQRPRHERHSSASALLFAQLSPNEYELGETLNSSESCPDSLSSS
jgi:hypothetical protein